MKRLQESKKPGLWENIDEFTSILSKEVCNELGADKKTVDDLLANWEFVNEPNEKMSHAFYVLFDNFHKNPDYKKCKSTIRTFFRGVSNDALDSFDAMERSINDSVFIFIKRYLTENIIYNHYAESMRKFSQNGIPTQKLTIENGFVKGIDTYYATHSSPRIDTLRNYATDLGLIANYKVTNEGLKLLKSLKDD